MTEVHQIGGGADALARLIKDIKTRVASLETKSTGSIFISDQMITEDPITGVETIFGALPDGTHGMMEFINDIEPPPVPSGPTVSGDRAVFEISWDGGTATAEPQPRDYDRTVVEMSESAVGPIWVEINYLTSAGSVVLANQPYGEERFFRLISIDKNGNRSEPSAIASATLVSYMESPEMTQYISDVEDAVTSAQQDAANAQIAAQQAADAAENAERLAQEAGNGSENLIKNNSFEQDFTDWVQEANPGTIDTAEFFSGTKSWKIGTVGAGIYQAGIPVQEGQIYNYEMAYKTIPTYAVGNSGGLRLQTSTNNGGSYTNTLGPNVAVNTSWTILSVDYKVPTGVTHIRPRIAFASSGTMGVWVDAVKLTNVTTLRLLEKTAQEAKDIASGAAEAAANAAIAAGNAQTSANGKNRSWYQDTAPTGTSHTEGDIWFNTADSNKISIWKNGTWTSARDAGIAQAISAANSAGTAAQTAVTAANGKNKNTTSSEVAPPSYTGTIGDIWWQKQDQAPFSIIKQSHWTGSAWVEDQFTSAIFSSIDAGDINVGTLDAAVIGAETITSFHMATNTITADSGIIASLDLGKATVGELDAIRLKAGSVTVDKLVVGQGENFITSAEFPAPTTSPLNVTQARISQSTTGVTWLSPNRLGWTSTTANTTARTLRLGNSTTDPLASTIPVIGGRNYVITWRVFSSATSTTVGTRAAINWVRAGTTTPTYETFPTYKMVSATGLSLEIVNEFKAPEDAIFMRIDLQTNGHPGGGRFDFLRPSVRLMTDGTVLTEDSVLTKHIGANQITGDVLDIGYIKGQVITGTMFQGGEAITGGVFQQATFQTSATPGVGSKMSPTLGFVSYGADNQPVFSVDPQGQAFFKGSVVITGNTSSIPMNAVTNLGTKMTELDTTKGIVDSWKVSDANTTLIDGGKIMTNTIDAEKINLGSSANMVPGGYGDPQEPWPGFTHTNQVPLNTIEGVTGIYWLKTNNVGLSQFFDMAGVSRYSFSYQWMPVAEMLHHWIEIEYYNINGVVFAEKVFGLRSVSQANNIVYSYSDSNIVPPEGTVSARIVVIANNTGVGGTSPTPEQWHRFMAFRVNVGVETKLTAAGLTSYKDGVQTVRINGDNNMLIGDLMTGRPGMEPHMKMTSRPSVSAIDFYGGPDSVANHGAMWWNQGSVDNALWGKLSLFAMDDSKTQGSPAYYAAGMEFIGMGAVTFKGKLDSGNSTMIKCGEIHYAGGFAAGSFGTYTESFPSAFPSGTIPRVLLTPNAAAGVEVVVTVKSRTATSFTYMVVNIGPRNTNEFSLTWLAMRTN